MVARRCRLLQTVPLLAISALLWIACCSLCATCASSIDSASSSSNGDEPPYTAYCDGDANTDARDDHECHRPRIKEGSGPAAAAAAARRMVNAYASSRLAAINMDTAMRVDDDDDDAEWQTQTARHSVSAIDDIRRDLLRDAELLWGSGTGQQQQQQQDLDLESLVGEAMAMLDDAAAAAAATGSSNSGADKKQTQTQEQEQTNKAKKLAGDRFVKGYVDVQSDPDCTSREFDVAALYGSASGTSPSSRAERARFVDEARRVFRKCKVLLLRNAIDVNFMTEYRDNFTDFVHAINDGRISAEGSTTWGEDSYVRDIDVGRWEMLLPRRYADPRIVANPAVLDVLSDDGILGPQLVLHNFGAVLAEPDAAAQEWHYDADYLFAEKSLATSGVAGHDLPSYVVTMFSPLLDAVTDRHGPTEFCLGSSYLQGFNPEDRRNLDITDDALREALEKYNNHVKDYARPPECHHSANLNLGDILLFDYQVEHRGGHNTSPDLRTLLYMSYSRYWYRDVNFVDDFEEGHRSKGRLLRQLLSTTRFGVPSDSGGATRGGGDDGSEGKSRLQDMKRFLPDLATHEVEEYPPGVGVEFLVSNRDVAPDNNLHHLHIYVGGKKLGPLLPGGSVKVLARPGDEVMAVCSSAGNGGGDGGLDLEVIKSWSVVPDQGQVVISNRLLRAPDHEQVGGGGMRVA